MHLARCEMKPGDNVLLAKTGRQAPRLCFACKLSVQPITNKALVAQLRCSWLRRSKQSHFEVNFILHLLCPTDSTFPCFISSRYTQPYTRNSRHHTPQSVKPHLPCPQTRPWTESTSKGHTTASHSSIPQSSDCLTTTISGLAFRSLEDVGFG